MRTTTFPQNWETLSPMSYYGPADPVDVESDEHEVPTFELEIGPAGELVLVEA